MPRPDSSGSSRKRGNTSRPVSGEKKTYGKKGARPSRFDKGSDQSKPRFKRDDSDNKRAASRSGKKFASDKPSGFKKRDDRPGRGERSSSESRERKFGDRSKRNEREEKRPFSRDKKSDDRSSSFRGRPAGAERSSDRRRPSKFDRAGKEDSSPIRKEARGTRPRKSFASREIEAEIPVQSDKVRLNKFIANSGVCSRREADELITMGLISVNGKTITELGYKVNPGDEVRYESKVLRSERPVYVLMNKPKGYLTTTSDPEERNTVMHIIGNAVKERIYPVGRLDRNTTGLLLLTNDGDLADKLMHPSYNAKKIYKVELDRPLTKADFDRIVEGVQLEEGRAIIDDIAIISDDKKTVGLEIHIGWNRVVRRIFESLDYQVVKLDRSVYAGLDKKDLPRGHWRFLTQEEIVRLKHYTASAKKSRA